MFDNQVNAAITSFVKCSDFWGSFKASSILQWHLFLCSLSNPWSRNSVINGIGMKHLVCSDEASVSFSMHYLAFFLMFCRWCKVTAQFLDWGKVLMPFSWHCTSFGSTVAALWNIFSIPKLLHSFSGSILKEFWRNCCNLIVVLVGPTNSKQKACKVSLFYLLKIGFFGVFF